MSVIFLDHGGVLYLGEPFGDKILRDFDAECVKVLNSIILETDCELVISSDWKTWTSIEQMSEFYKSQGILKSPIGFTDKFVEYYDWNKLPNQRSFEIINWLETNDVDKWVVLDDLDMSNHIDNFIKIDPSIGLCREYYLEIIRKLKYDFL
jgi:hypothetical protein